MAFSFNNGLFVNIVRQKSQIPFVKISTKRHSLPPILFLIPSNRNSFIMIRKQTLKCTHQVFIRPKNRQANSTTQVVQGFRDSHIIKSLFYRVRVRKSQRFNTHSLQDVKVYNSYKKALSVFLKPLFSIVLLSFVLVVVNRLQMFSMTLFEHLFYAQ